MHLIMTQTYSDPQSQAKFQEFPGTRAEQSKTRGLGSRDPGQMETYFRIELKLKLKASSVGTDQLGIS